MSNGQRCEPAQDFTRQWRPGPPAACGWVDDTPAMRDEETLRRLLALNRERAAQEPSASAWR